MTGIDEDYLAVRANELEFKNSNQNYKYWADVRDIVTAYDEIIAKIQDDEWRGEEPEYLQKGKPREKVAHPKVKIMTGLK